MKRVWLLLGLLMPALALSASATTPVEASMVVTGTITVNPDGSVNTYSIHDMNKLPPAARQIVQATVPHWEFKPVMTDGKAVTAKSGMSLRIVADMTNGKNVTLRVAGAAFGCEAQTRKSAGECPVGSSVSYAHAKPPRYPKDALSAGMGGEVFLVLEVGRDGQVTQAAVRRVNLYSRIDDPSRYRKALADASLQAARKWQFHIPSVGPNALKNHWIVQVPINYRFPVYLQKRYSPIYELQGTTYLHRKRYGHWSSYVPGPLRLIPWADENRHVASGESADAIPGGTLFQADPRFVLLTPLAGAQGNSNRGG